MFDYYLTKIIDISSKEYTCCSLFISSILLAKLFSKCSTTTCSTGIMNHNKVSKELYPYVAKQILPKDGADITTTQVPFYCEKLSLEESYSRANAFYMLQNQRRSVRFFSQEPFPVDLLLKCVAAGGTAPSGAHQQPWHFSIVKSMDIKHQIRELVEHEEQINYDKRMGEAWKKDLAHIFEGSALHKNGEIKKPYLTEAPYIVVVTEVTYGLDEAGKRFTHHYVKESVGIACGLFIAALTNIGLFTLTSTPLNAGSQICKILNRPVNEKLYLLMPLGYPALNATVPYRDEISVENPHHTPQHNSEMRKHMNNICKIYE